MDKCPFNAASKADLLAFFESHLELELKAGDKLECIVRSGEETWQKEEGPVDGWWFLSPEWIANNLNIDEGEGAQP